MKHLAALLLIGLLATGCDSRGFAGPEQETPGTPPGATIAFDVTYRVEGTYHSCEITYLDAARGVVSLPNAVQLPWSLSFKVDVGPATGPFDAHVSATCADPARLGKSTVALLVNDEVKARSNGVGFGVTASAVHTIGVP